MEAVDPVVLQIYPEINTQVKQDKEDRKRQHGQDNLCLKCSLSNDYVYNLAYPAACDPAYHVNKIKPGTHLRDEP